MSQKRRVVLTGVGLVTPLGLGVRETLAAIERGERALAPATRFDASGFPEPRAGEVTALDPRQYFTAPKAIKLTDQAARLGVVAARLARDASGYPHDEPSLETLGVLFGCSGSDLQAAALARALAPDAEARAAHDIPFFAERILAGLNPLWLLVHLANMISAHVATQLGARGPNSTVMTDCVAGLQAVGEACEWIREGEVDAVLAGGAETGVLPFIYGAYEQAGLFEAAATSDAPAAMVPGEGAAAFMLEERDTAIARGAPILGEVMAYASAASPGLDVAGGGGGALAWTLERALHEAACAPAAAGRLVVASLGSAAHRAMTSAAVQTVFGAHGDRVVAPDHAGLMGHALGASGAIEAALMLATAPPGAIHLCSALGYSGQAVTVAFRAGHNGGGAS